jgi:2'-hydroxyisoflavone reductase
MGGLVGTLVDAARARGLAVVPAWIEEATLQEHGVVPWMGLPLWIPANEPGSAGFMLISSDRAIAKGLRFRPLEQTIADTAAWLGARDNAAAWKGVLSAAKERELQASRADGRRVAPGVQP